MSHHKKHPIRSAFVSMLTTPVLVLFGWLSPRAAWRLACFAGFIMRLFRTSSYKIACANIRIAFPEKSDAEVEALVREYLKHTTVTGLEVIRLIRHPETLRASIAAYPEHFLKVARENAEITCMPHMGNWEVAGQASPLFGIESSAIAERLANEKLNTIMERARSSNGLEIIYKDGAAIKVCNALRAKRNVGMLVDQNLTPRKGGIFTEFFGLPATASSLPAQLAMRYNVPVFVGACIRQPDLTFAMEFDTLPKATSEYTSVEELTLDIFRGFEKIIRRHPEQYVWIYRRWRYIPSDVSEKVEKRFPFYAEKKEYAMNRVVEHNEVEE